MTRLRTLAAAVAAALGSTAAHAVAAPALLQDGTATSDPAALRPDEVRTETALSVFDTPEYRRRIADSYLSETEIEPRITSLELEELQPILELLSDGKLEQARKDLEAARASSGNAVFDYTLANTYYEKDDYEHAATLYEAALEKHPKFRRAWQQVGACYARLERWKDTAGALREVVKLGGGDGITYGLLGYACWNQNELLSAESAYRMAVLLDPATTDWKVGLARSLLRQQRFAEAAALFDLLIAEQPGNGELWMLQANAYLGLEQYAKAAENFELVQRLGKSTPQSLAKLGDIYMHEGLYDLSARAHVLAARVSAPGDVKAALAAARNLANRGALPEARRIADAIDDAHGETVTAESLKTLLKLRARFAVADGAGEEEAAVLGRIVEIDPLDGEALILLGEHSRRAGDEEQAVFYYERAEAIEASEADARLAHAQLLARQGKYKEALPLLRRAQAIRFRENVQQFLDDVEARANAGR